MTDFLDQYAAQFRAAAEAQTARRRRVPVAPVAVAGLAAAAVVFAVVSGDRFTRDAEIERKPPVTATNGGYARQRALLGVLRRPAEAGRHRQVRQTLRDLRELGPRTARLLGFAPSGSAYVLVATREWKEIIQPPPPIHPGDDIQTRTHRNGLCLVRRSTQGQVRTCLGTEAIRAGLLWGAIAGEVYGLVPDGVTHVVPPRGRPPVRVDRNFYRYPARGYAGPPPIWLDARGNEVHKVSAAGELPFLTHSDFAQVSAFRGRGPVVVGLWASWCKPCEPQLRVLKELYERLGESGDAEVLGIATRDGTAAAQATLKRLGIRFSVLSDAAGREAKRLGVDAFPETLVLSTEGKITARFRGPASLEQLEEAVRRAR